MLISPSEKYSVLDPVPPEKKSITTLKRNIINSLLCKSSLIMFFFFFYTKAASMADLFTENSNKHEDKQYSQGFPIKPENENLID